MSLCEVITLKQILLLSPEFKQRGDPFSWLPGSDEPYQATKIEILLFWEGKIRKALVPIPLNRLVSNWGLSVWICDPWQSLGRSDIIQQHMRRWSASTSTLLPPLFLRWTEPKKEGRLGYGCSSGEREQESKADQKEFWFSESGEKSSFLFAESALCAGRVSADPQGGAYWTWGKPDHQQHPPTSSAQSCQTSWEHNYSGPLLKRVAYVKCSKQHLILQGVFVRIKFGCCDRDPKLPKSYSHYGTQRKW